MAEFEHLPAPKGNFTPGPECYQRCLDWVEECELLLNGPLASKSKAVKANYVLIWAGKTGRTHIKSLNLTTEQKGDPSVPLKKFVEWTKPKSNAIAAASNFRRLEQGDLSLAEYIDKATILCDQREYPPEARDRLLRDAIVIGLRSKEFYYKCIEKGSSLTLEEAIEIAQNQDATAHQVGYMRPEFRGDPLQMEVHKLQGNRQLGAKWNRQQPQRPGPSDQSHRTSSNDQKQGKPREKVVSTVERSRYIPKVSVQQRRQSASSVGRKGITVPYADQRVRMHVSMSYKSMLEQLPSAWTAYLLNTSQFTSTRLFITSRQ